MKLFQRIKSRIRLFFLVDVVLFLERRSLFSKILMAAGVSVLLHLLAFGFFFGGVMLLGSFTYDLELLHSDAEISQIEIIYVSQNHLQDDASFEDAAVCVSLEAHQWDAFLSDLHEITCRPTGFDATPHIQGAVIRIIYANGDYELLAGYGIYQWKNGEEALLRRRLDDEELLQLLNAYGYQQPEPEETASPEKPQKPPPPNK